MVKALLAEKVGFGSRSQKDGHDGLAFDHTVEFHHFPFFPGAQEQDGHPRCVRVLIFQRVVASLMS